MRLLCVSDMIDPLVYNQNAHEMFKDVDAILCAGDLPMDYVDFIVSTFNRPTYFVFGNHNLEEWKYYHKEKGFAAGSMYEAARRAASNKGHGAVYAGFKVLRCRSLAVHDEATGKDRPLLMAGTSGSLRYNNGLAQYSEWEMALKLLLMWPALLWNKIRYGTYLDIFLTHATPRHIHDAEDPCHRGFGCFNKFIARFHPAYLVHGHIHLYDIRMPRTTTVGEGDAKTVVINAYAHTVIDLPPKAQADDKLDDREE